MKYVQRSKNETKWHVIDSTRKWEGNYKQQFTLKLLNMYIHAQLPNRRSYHNIYPQTPLFSCLHDKLALYKVNKIVCLSPSQNANKTNCCFHFNHFVLNVYKLESFMTKLFDRYLQWKVIRASCFLHITYTNCNQIFQCLME